MVFLTPTVDVSILGDTLGVGNVNASTINIGKNGTNINLNGTVSFNGISGSGTNGPIGATGLIGMTGINGPTGWTGVAGIHGFTGVAGINGSTGFTGIAGFTGWTGINGSTGWTGVAGVDGITGVIGITGPTGLIGITGFTGWTGETGIGITGVTGITGPIGATGPAGSGSGSVSGSGITLTNNNVSLGIDALYSNINGSNNNAIGFQTLYNNAGSYNSAHGYQSLKNNTTGNYNIGIGYNCQTGTTASYSTAIGFNASTQNFNYSTAIGYQAVNTAENQIMLGSGETVAITGRLNAGSIGRPLYIDSYSGYSNPVEFGQGGGQIRWNQSGANGELDIISYSGLGVGGVNLYGVNTNTANYANEQPQLIFSALRSGCFSPSTFSFTSSATRQVYVGSDGRLGSKASTRETKESIVPLDSSASEIIYQFQPYSFVYKQDTDKSHLHIGYIAEDIALLDKKVTGYETDSSGNETIYSVFYDDIVVYAVEEIKKLKSQIDILTSTVNTLTERINSNNS